MEHIEKTCLETELIEVWQKGVFAGAPGMQAMNLRILRGRAPCAVSA